MDGSIPDVDTVSDVINSSKIACLAENTSVKMKVRELATPNY